MMKVNYDILTRAAVAIAKNRPDLLPPSVKLAAISIGENAQHLLVKRAQDLAHLSWVEPFLELPDDVKGPYISHISPGVLAYYQQQKEQSQQALPQAPVAASKPVGSGSIFDWIKSYLQPASGRADRPASATPRPQTQAAAPKPPEQPISVEELLTAPAKPENEASSAAPPPPSVFGGETASTDQQQKKPTEKTQKREEKKKEDPLSVENLISAINMKMEQAAKNYSLDQASFSSDNVQTLLRGARGWISDVVAKKPAPEAAALISVVEKQMIDLIKSHVKLGLGLLSGSYELDVEGLLRDLPPFAEKVIGRKLTEDEKRKLSQAVTWMLYRMAK